MSSSSPAQSRPSSHSTLIEVVAAIIPLIDTFPHLQWKGSISGEDFVEQWFPFVADYVQNGVYDPPSYITNPPHQKRGKGTTTPVVTSPNSSLLRRRSPSPAIRGRNNNRSLISPQSSGQQVYSDEEPPSSSPSNKRASLSSFLKPAVVAATRERASSISSYIHGANQGRGRSTSVALSSRSVVPAVAVDPNTVASVTILRSFVSTATALVVYKLKLLDMEAESLIRNVTATQRRESLVPSVMQHASSSSGAPQVPRTQQSPSATLRLPISPPRNSREKQEVSWESSGRDDSVLPFALGSSERMLVSFCPEDSGDVFGHQIIEGNVVHAHQPTPQKRNTRSTLGANLFASNANEGGIGGVAAPSRCGGSPPKPQQQQLECLPNERNHIGGVKREILIREIQRVWSTPKGRRPGFANGHFRSFGDLRVFVETLLSALFSAASEPFESERISWLDFQAYLTDGAIAYNTQLSLRDFPIFVEDATATVSGSVTFIGTAVSSSHHSTAIPQKLTALHSDSPSPPTSPPSPLTPPSVSPIAPKATGGGQPPQVHPMVCRMVLTVQQGVSAPSLVVMPPSVVHPANPRTTTIPSPSATIKSVEYLEHVMCFVCCSDRAVHFYDFRFGANTGNEIASFALDTLMDSPCSMLWLPDHGKFVVGGISGYLWKILPPAWSAAKREWKMPTLMHCSSSHHHSTGGVVNSNGTAGDVAGGGGGGPPPSPLFQDTVHIIRRAFHPSLLFIGSRATVFLFDVVHDTVKLTHHAHSDGVHHIAGLVFNQATQYLLCNGETLQILVWLSPNLPRQSPVKLQDMIAPHTGHIIGLETHPTAPIVVSMDFHGAVKIWDLDSMSCSQNIFLQMPRVVDVNRLHLRFYGRSICTVVQNKITLFKVDEETIDAAPSAVFTHPKGGSFTFAVNRDLVQLSSLEGKKEIHHQNISDVEIIQACLAGNSTVALLNSFGAVTMHSVSSGKLIVSYGRKQLKAEGVDLAYCSEFRRVVVATASPIVWFLPTEFSSDIVPSSSSSSGGGGVGGSPGSDIVPHHNHHPSSPLNLKKIATSNTSKNPLMVTLDPQDGAASCVSLGCHEKQSLYCVGTVENSVCIFALSASGVVPRTARLIHRIPPPPSSSPLDSNNDAEGNAEPDIITTLILSLRTLVVFDSAGFVRAYRPGSWTYLMRCHLWELVLSGGRDIGSISNDERAEYYALSTEKDVAPKVLCSCHYKPDSVIAVGDSLGRILFIDVTRSLTLLHWWHAHSEGGGGINRIAIEKETVATVGESAALYIWMSSGTYMGNVWGRGAAPIEIPSEQPPPEWLDESALIGESSIMLRKHSSRHRRSFTRAVSVVERVARLTKMGLVAGSRRASATPTTPTSASACGASPLLCGSASLASSSVSRTLNFSGADVAVKTVVGDLLPRRQRKSTAVMEPSVSFVQSMGNASFDIDEQGSVADSRRSSLTDGHEATSYPLPTEGSELLEVTTPRTNDHSEDDSAVSNASSFLFEGLSCELQPAEVPSMQRRKNHDYEESADLSQQDSFSLPTHLRPIAWKSNDVTALDNKFREILGQQRILSCASQVLGQPNTMLRRVLPPRDMHPLSHPIAHSMPAATVTLKKTKSRTSVSPTTLAAAKPRLTITLNRSGNTVTSPERRSRSSIN